ncbi:RNA polymerase sigma factor [Eubacterium sp. ER2]|uniref:RNA polymerase sigma factor n=1 Tax=Eubacterium sp. ER2 TaxID=1519438 RepID=UPI000ADC5B71
MDFVLIRRMKQGDEEAFDLFVRKYYRDILVYCICRCGNREEAQDLTQETFIRFFARLSAYCHREKAKNYLYTIARHLCLDYLKKRKEMPTPDRELTEKLEQTDLNRESSPDREFHLDRIAIESALKKLPEEQREAVILYYFSGLKLREIAETLGIKTPLVKYRLRQAKNVLRQLLQPGGEEEDGI